MAKTHHWTVSAGEVVKVGPFSRGLSNPEIAAPTKGEATKLLLTRLAQIANASAPRLWVKNGGYAIAYHNGEKYAVEGGRLDRINSKGQVEPLVMGQADTVNEVPRVASLDHYGRADYGT